MNLENFGIKILFKDSLISDKLQSLMLFFLKCLSFYFKALFFGRQYYLCSKFLMHDRPKS